MKPKKEKTTKKDSKKEYQGRRLTILLLLLGTIILSILFWLRAHLTPLWDQLTQPWTYEIEGE